MASPGRSGHQYDKATKATQSLVIRAKGEALRFWKNIMAASRPSIHSVLFIAFFVFPLSAVSLESLPTAESISTTIGDTPRLKLWQMAAYLFPSGALLFAGLSNLTVFLLRRRERAHGWFAVLCFSVMLNVLLPSFSHLPFDLFVQWFTDGMILRLDLITLAIAIIAAALLTRELFPLDILPWLHRAFVFFSCIGATGGILLPQQGVRFAYNFYLAGVGIFSLYSCFVVIRAIHKRRVDSVLAGIGILITSLSGGFDVLWILGFIEHDVLLVPIALVIFTYLMSYIVARRMTTAWVASEKLGSELREKNAALSRMDAVKDQFLANTSHELRTPLAGIIGIAESLKEDYHDTPEHIRQNLELIATSGKRLTTLVNDILDFSRLEHEDIQLNKQPVQLASVLQTVTALTQPMVAGKPVAILLNLNKCKDTLVDADENRLQQILFNLLGNAVKFTHKGSVTVSTDRRNDMVHVSISDTGPGMDTKEIESLFRPFERGDKHDHHPGTGLGLGIARHLIELHGGTIKIDSSPGKGSIVSFTVPCTEATSESDTSDIAQLTPVVEDLILSNAMEQPHFTPLPKKQGAQGTVRILVVDDEPVNLHIASNLLGAAGYVVETCTSGFQAIERLDADPSIDLVLLDLMMPEISGYEVCERIRKISSHTQIPVIMVTARNRVSELVRGFDVGANDYLVKPYSRKELLARVQMHLQLKNSFAAQEENHRLRAKMLLKIREEQALRMLHRRLAEMLNTVPLPLCAIDDSGIVVFANEESCGLLGEQHHDLIGRSIDTRIIPVGENSGMSLIDRSANLGPNERFCLPVALPHGSNGSESRLLEALPLSVEDDSLTVLIFRSQEERNPMESAAELLVEELNRNRGRLETMSRALQTLLPDAAGDDHKVYSELEAIDVALDQLGKALKSSDAKSDRRTVAKEIMEQVVNCWENCQGRSRLDLARESGQWRVEVTPDGFERARTLDRYLDIRTLPKRPRIKKVLATGDFVLAHCCENRECRRHLESSMSRLRLT